MSAYRGAVLRDTPLGYWPLDESSGTVAYDVSGNGRHGTYAGGPVQGIAGPFGMGKACTFDGSNDIISFGNPAWAQIGQPITVEAWFWSSSGADPLNIAVKSNAYGLYSRPGGLSCYDWAFGNWRNSGSANMANSVWHHVAGVYASSTATWYADGAQAGSGTAFSSPAGQAANLNFGADSPTVQHMTGRLAHIAIYPTALSAAQVLAHYKASQREAVSY